MWMKKIKYMLLLAVIGGSIASCKEDNFDAEAQFSADTTAIRSYVTANSIPVIKDKYGIFYQIIAPGTGNVTYTGSTIVTVDYSGKVLGEATNFDSTSGTPATFMLGSLIKGWQIGIPYIQQGGKIRLFIPSAYGYGNEAQSAIPANSVLDFTIELTTGGQAL
jgi:FKBP-type peptidyl-prolyl cis-trans isomerase FkpA